MVNWETPLGHCSSGVLTANYMQKGLVAAAFRGIGLLSTRKRVPEPHLVGRILRLLRSGRNVLIYPEGGRRWDGRPGRWIPSTAKLFSRAGYPVHPVITHGSYVAWPRWATWPRPARIEVHILDAVPLSVDGALDDAVSALSAPLALDENRPPARVRPRTAFRPADGLERLLYRDPYSGEHDAIYTDDGHRIRSRSSPLRWRMLPDSTILDETTGERLLTGDLYARIRSLPLDPGPDGYIRHSRVTLTEGPDPLALANRRPESRRNATRISLAGDHISLSTAGNLETIGLDEVLFVGIERNDRLQLTLRDRLIEAAFPDGGSALFWEDALHALKTGTD